MLGQPCSLSLSRSLFLSLSLSLALSDVMLEHQALFKDLLACSDRQNKRLQSEVHNPHTHYIYI